MTNEDTNVERIVILEKNIKGDLSKCNICNINFTAFQPCIICQLIIEKEEDLGRKLNEKELCGLQEDLMR